MIRDLPLDPPPHEVEVPDESTDADLCGPTDVGGTAIRSSTLSEYGDEASLSKLRSEALDVFDSRLFDLHGYVAVWVDRLHVWGIHCYYAWERPLMDTVRFWAL